MKWRHWSILIILLLLNYIIFSMAFTRLASQRQPGPRSTRTPPPTFDIVDPTPVAWIVLPTSTPLLTNTAEAGAEATALPSPGDTPLPAGSLSHTVQAGETLSGIAGQYGVTVQAIMDANGLSDPGLIVIGQALVIPAPAPVPPTATATPQPPPANTPKPAPTKAPTPKPTKKPPTATPAPTAPKYQFTAEVSWPWDVAPNCAGPGISKQSLIHDAAGNPLNGVRVGVDCYGNKWVSHPSGTPGEYDAGHYDFAFGQTSPQDWTCTAFIVDANGQPLPSSEVVTIHFDTNNCRPGGDGHQVAIVNWTKHW
jgi:LysM repeat protein